MVSVATHQAPPALRNPAEIPIYVLCVILNVVIAVVLVGLAIVELAPTPMHALVIISTPLRLVIAAILLAAFVFGILFVLGRQLTRAASRGNSVLASSGQFPDIDAMLRGVCSSAWASSSGDANPRSTSRPATACSMCSRPAPSVTTTWW